MVDKGCFCCVLICFANISGAASDKVECTVILVTLTMYDAVYSDFSTRFLATIKAVSCAYFAWLACLKPVDIQFDSFSLV